jgi:hypothetical protein
MHGNPSPEATVPMGFFFNSEMLAVVSARMTCDMFSSSQLFALKIAL